MLLIDKFLLAYVGVFTLFVIVFLLYQFDVLNCDESIMISGISVFNVLETIILVLTRFCNLGTWGVVSLGAFYVLNIMLLALQFGFAAFGVRRKILDCFWMSFYVMLFLLDICKVKFGEIDSFLRNSFIGEFILSVGTSVVRAIVLNAIREKE